MKYPESIVRASDVINVDVRSINGENLGEIKEIMLDKYNGKTRYVVLSFGGFLGLGDKLFALPWEAFNYDVAEDCFVLNVTKEKLENAPGFDKDEWPNTEDRVWGESIFKYYDLKPYWKE